VEAACVVELMPPHPSELAQRPLLARGEVLITTEAGRKEVEQFVPRRRREVKRGTSTCT
jgi:hypothetical protein